VETRGRPAAPKQTRADRERRQKRKLARVPARSPRTPGWADLLARVFQIDILACPRCNKPMQLRCIVIHPPATTRILRGLGAPRAPPRPGP
jgi:hypothetical protein